MAGIDEVQIAELAQGETVAREDVPRTRELLVSEGYRPEVRLTEAQEARLLRSQHAYAFVRDGGKLIVELHWETSPRQLSAPPDPQRL